MSFSHLGTLHKVGMDSLADDSVFYHCERSLDNAEGVDEKKGGRRFLRLVHLNN